MTNLFSIQDKDAITPLFSGDVLYCACINFSLNGANNIKEGIKTAQATFLSSDGSGNNKNITAYNRKKITSQYSGFSPPIITVDLVFKYDDASLNETTIHGSTKKILNPRKLLHMIRIPKTYYIKEEKFMNLMSETIVDEFYYYSSYGIPVIFKSYNFTVQTNGDIVVSLTFVEDVDGYFT